MPQPHVPSHPTHDDLASFRSEIDAMPSTSVLVPRVDVTTAALVAIGAMPEIEAHRAAVTELFGENGGLTLDRLVPIASALMLADGAFVADAERDLEPMAEEVMRVRTHLFLSISALIERRVADKKALANLEGGQGYQARIRDTIAMVSWLRSHAREIAEHTKVTDAELLAAQALAADFGKAVAERDQARSGASRTARDRARMFTLFFQTYERVRQMLGYLRWHEGDLEKIAPSVFAGRNRRASDDDVVVTPVPNANPVPPGMPGADPFPTT